jgi:hypothetical protein
MPAAQIFSGTGDPNGSVTANPGDIYQDENGKLWSKASGADTNTGWSQVAPGVFVAGAGAGSVIQNNASGNATTGVDSTVCGENNQLSGEASFAEGAQNVETIAVSGPGAVANHLEGFRHAITCSAPDGGSLNHVEGFQHSLTDGGSGNPVDFNHVEGSQNTLTATGGLIEFNHVEGTGNALLCNANEVSFNHVEGDSHHLTATTDIVDECHVEGFDNLVTDTDICHVEGWGAHAIRSTQHVKASGTFSPVSGAAGDAQTSKLVFRGATPGIAANESVELKFSGAGTPAIDEFTLENGKYYAIEIDAVAAQNGGGTMATFRTPTVFAAFQEAGVVTVLPTPGPLTNDQNVGAGAASWTMSVSAGVGPARVVITFSTGAGITAAVRVVATVRFTEVLRL